MIPDSVSSQSNDEETCQRVHPTFVLGLSTIILGSLFLVSSYFWCQRPLLQYPDQSMYLAMAQLYVDGYKPYVDMVDFNPPLIMYICLAPALMSNLFHIHIIFAFAIFVLALTLLSVMVCGYLMFSNRHREEAFFYLPILMVFLYLGSQLMIDFGQREHLLLITYLPFFMIRHLRWNCVAINKGLAVFCGLYASICLILKPHFIFMAAVPELVYLIQKRRWKCFLTPETFACIPIGVIYGAHFLFLDNAVRDSFFQFVLPLVKNGYDYYTVSPLKTIADVVRIEVYILIFSFILSVGMSRYCALIAPIGAFTAGALVVYLVAGQDWQHHWVPVRFGMYSLLALEAAVVIRSLCSYSEHARLLNVYMVSILITVATLLWSGAKCSEIKRNASDGPRFDLATIGYSGECPRNDLGPWVAIIQKHSELGQPVLFISDALGPGYPATLQACRLPASRYLHGMPLMMAKHLAFEKLGVDDRPKFEQFYQDIIRNYGADIARTKPTLIVIRSTAIMEPLERADFFNKYLRDYEKVNSFEGHFIYRLK